MGITCYHRTDADAPWVAERVEGHDGLLSVPAIGCVLPLKAIYARCDFQSGQVHGAPGNPSVPAVPNGGSATR